VIIQRRHFIFLTPSHSRHSHTAPFQFSTNSYGFYVVYNNAPHYIYYLIYHILILYYTMLEFVPLMYAAAYEVDRIFFER